MSFAARSVASTFPTTVVTYNSGSGTETAPVGATQVVIELWGGGGGGARDTVGNDSRGGGAGAYCKKTQAVTGGVTSFAYTVGVGGNGKTTTDGAGQIGSASQITSPALTAGAGNGGNFGVATPSPGGTASGGDVNTTGGSSAGAGSAVGGASPNGGAGGANGAVGGTPGGGGGAQNLGAGNAGNGGPGRITFTYT